MEEPSDLKVKHDTGEGGRAPVSTCKLLSWPGLFCLDVLVT